ncbi:MAG: energy transducer TonB [Gemmatimonadetes bacterium]|nr:energy transducer TonB [Gemmatimonadota bacterium]
MTQTLRSVALGLLVLAGCAEELPETPPKQLEGSPFHYPEDLWDAGVEGETVLRLYVTESGAVDSVQVEQASGYAAFDSSAVLGARDLRFEPAKRGAETLGAWVLLPVQFDLPSGDGAGAPSAR